MNLPTFLSDPEVKTIQGHLRKAMRALDACGQDDLAEEVKVIFKRVAARQFPTQTGTQ